MRARYLVLDGPDGCGKSTQARLLCDRVAADGVEAVHLREPGSTPTGERLRELLLDGEEIEPLTEALLFSAARAEMVAREVAPALARGAVVVVERCFLSTWVYQCAAPAPERAAPLALVRAVTERVHAPARPDRVLVLDVSATTSAARIAAGRPDRIERRGAEFLERVRAAFLRIAGDGGAFEGVLAPGGRVAVIDAEDSIAAVHDAVWAAV